MRYHLLWFTALFSVFASAQPLRIYYTANRQGEVDPCGCQVNQIGGLSRLQTFLDRDRKAQGDKPSFLGDAGDTFFASNAIAETRRQSEILKAKVIAESYKILKVDAFTPGERDFAAGGETLKELQKISGTPFVSANLADEKGQLLFEPYRIVKKGNVRIGVTGIADPKAFEGVKGVTVKPAMETLKQIYSTLKDESDVIVVLSHLGLPLDREVAKLERPTLIIGSHSQDMLQEAVIVDKTTIVQPSNQGQTFGIFDLEPRYHRLVELDKPLDADNEIAKLVKDYKEKLREIAMTESVDVKSTTKRPFVAHPVQCRTCHEKQYDFWETTKHASAYLVLYAKSQHFDPDCIACHSLGFKQPGGFPKIAHPMMMTGKPAKKGTSFTEDFMKSVFASDPGKGSLDSRTDAERYRTLKTKYHAGLKELEDKKKIKQNFVGIQCEHCHGNRNGHPSAKVPTQKKVVETSCRQCHVPPHDTDFDFTRDVAKVGCPLSSKI